MCYQTQPAFALLPAPRLAYTDCSHSLLRGWACVLYQPHADDDCLLRLDAAYLLRRIDVCLLYRIDDYRLWLNAIGMCWADANRARRMDASVLPDRCVIA